MVRYGKQHAWNWGTDDDYREATSDKSELKDDDDDAKDETERRAGGSSLP